MAEEKPKVEQSDQESLMSRLTARLRRVGVSRMYTFEYFLMLLHIGIGLILVNSLFNLVLDSWVRDKTEVVSGSYAQTVSMVAALIVVFSLFSVLFMRVRAAEENDSSLRERNWRKVWQNSFLVVLFVWLLTSTVSLLEDIVSALLDVGLEERAESLYLTFGRNLFIIALLLLVMRYVYDRINYSDDEDRRFMVAFVGIASLLLVLTAVYPLTDQRNVKIDSVIASDLQTISDKVDDLVSSDGELPASLNELDLSKSIEDRADKYNYEYNRKSQSSFSADYELCAEFKTDTNELETPSQTPDFFDLLTGPDIETSHGDSFLTHGDGRHCFNLSANSFSPFSSDDSSVPFEFDFGSLDGFEPEDANSLFEAIQ